MPPRTLRKSGDAQKVPIRTLSAKHVGLADDVLCCVRELKGSMVRLHGCGAAAKKTFWRLIEAENAVGNRIRIFRSWHPICCDPANFAKVKRLFAQAAE